MPKVSYSVLFKNKIKKFKKVTNVDSDKSVSIRSFLIGSISHGVSEVKNVLESEDLFSTIDCLKKLGVIFMVRVWDPYMQKKTVY